MWQHVFSFTSSARWEKLTLALALSLCLIGHVAAAESTAAAAPLPIATPVERAQRALTLKDPESAVTFASLLKTAEPTDQAKLFALIPAGRPGYVTLISERLLDEDPAVRVLAMARVVQCWPTAAEHLTVIRKLIGSRDDTVAKAAIGAIATIGDDLPLAPLIDRLIDGGEIAKAARLALITLTGRDFGLEPRMWEPFLAERDQRLATTLAKARADFATSKHELARTALHEVMLLNASRSAVAEALAPLQSSADLQIAALARGGLGNLGGGVAQLVLKGGQLPTTNPQDIRPARPIIPPDHTGWYALAAIVSLIGIVGFVLFRTPLKDTKIVREATRAFKRGVTRSFARTGLPRQLDQAKKNLAATDLYRKGVRTAKKFESSTVYRALVKKSAVTVVHEATASFRRTKP